MARITRKNQKIFAESATNNGVFGSLQANDPTISNDPDVIQGRSAYANGWNDAAYSSELLPPLEEFQALQYLFSRQLAYLFQEGIAEWNTSTTYYIGSIVKVISSSVIRVYMSIVNNNTGNLTTDTTKWKLLFDSSLGYAYTDMSNLTSVGKNLGNWSTNLTNCITEIPQDINLELSSGTLTLKAGSKVYVPNGSGTFNTVTTSSDIVFTQNSSIGQNFIYVNSTGTSVSRHNNCASGTSVPSGFTGTFYNTSTNTIYYYNNGTQSAGPYSFPIAIITIGTDNTATVSSIDQVFNGFGYIGSTVFTLPGVKGLIPNGRNSDGTLKNTSFTVGSVKTLNAGYSNATNYFAIASSGALGQSRNYVVGEIAPTTVSTQWYKPSENRMYRVSNAGVLGAWNEVYFAKSSVDSNLKITSFEPKPAFHAADYYDLEKLDGENVKLTGAQTISGAKTFSGNITSSGTNTWSGTNTFTGTTTLSTTKLSKENSNLDGGQIHFEGANNEPNASKNIYIDRYNGQLRIVGKNSSDTTNIPFTVDIQNNTASVVTPSDTTSTSSLHIANVGWVNSVGNNVMHLSGAETAAGVKTFTDNPVVKKSGYASVVLRNDSITKGTGVDASVGAIEFKDSSGSNMGVVGTSYNASKLNRVRLTVYKANASSDTANAELAVYYPNSGDPYATCPTPSSATDNSTKIATTAWVAGHRCTTKATTTSSASVNAPAYIVQNYLNGKKWYRVWSDGWIEQGGETADNTSFTLAKAFSNTDYTVCNSPLVDHDKNAYIADKTTTTITFHYACSFYACGY